MTKEVTSSRDVLHDFGRWASGHGYRRIVLSSSLVARIVWAVLTAVCSILFIVFLVKVVQEYLKYPTSVTTHR